MQHKIHYRTFQASLAVASPEESLPSLSLLTRVGRVGLA